MSTVKRALASCILAPVVLIASCAGKMVYDAKMYDLPGEVMKSPLQPTRSLDTAQEVAEALDAYVQPRFEILRDKNFGAIRIVYPRHAGINQLKVDTQKEKESIADINAANRDYTINLLHCAPLPGDDTYTEPPHLEQLYIKTQQDPTVSDANASPTQRADDNVFMQEATEKQAVAALPQLMAGQEYRTQDASCEILMRPVLASKRECLACHTNAKPGATLGVMVYAVRKTRSNAAVQLGMR